MNHTRLFRIFFDTDMRCRHDGLSARALRDKVKVEDLKPGNLLAFVNSARDRLMVLAPTGEEGGHGVLGYYRSPRGRFTIEAIQYIPEAFSGGKIDMNKATRRALMEKLGIKEEE